MAKKIARKPAPRARKATKRSAVRAQPVAYIEPQRIGSNPFGDFVREFARPLDAFEVGQLPAKFRGPVERAIELRNSLTESIEAILRAGSQRADVDAEGRGLAREWTNAKANGVPRASAEKWFSGIRDRYSAFENRQAAVEAAESSAQTLCERINGASEGWAGRKLETQVQMAIVDCVQGSAAWLAARPGESLDTAVECSRERLQREHPEYHARLGNYSAMREAIAAWRASLDATNGTAAAGHWEAVAKVVNESGAVLNGKVNAATLKAAWNRARRG